MFDLEKQIDEWRQQMIAGGIADNAVLDELESHLREQAERLKKGLPDDEAFRFAAGQLGDSRQLKREFAKTNRFGFLFPRDNPVGLNVLGIFFLFSGLNALLSVTRVLLFVIPNFQLYSLEGLALLAIYGCSAGEILVGMGLLRRKNFWRRSAYVFAVLQALGSAQILCVQIRNVNFTGRYFAWMGVMVPQRFQFIPEALALAVMLWSIFYLSKPEVRGLFNETGKIKTANAT
jgi:hypothetical protein